MRANISVHYEDPLEEESLSVDAQFLRIEVQFEDLTGARSEVAEMKLVTREDLDVFVQLRDHILSLSRSLHVDLARLGRMLAADAIILGGGDVEATSDSDTPPLSPPSYVSPQQREFEILTSSIHHLCTSCADLISTRETDLLNLTTRLAVEQQQHNDSSSTSFFRRLTPALLVVTLGLIGGLVGGPLGGAVGVFGLGSELTFGVAVGAGVGAAVGAGAGGVVGGVRVLSAKEKEAARIKRRQELIEKMQGEIDIEELSRLSSGAIDLRQSLIELGLSDDDDEEEEEEEEGTEDGLVQIEFVGEEEREGEGEGEGKTDLSTSLMDGMKVQVVRLRESHAETDGEGGEREGEVDPVIVLDGEGMETEDEGEDHDPLVQVEEEEDSYAAWKFWRWFGS